MSPLGIGIIGCGNAAREYHSPALRRLPQVAVRCLYDPVPQNAHKLASAFPRATLAASVEELLRNQSVQAVAIITPPATHYSLVNQAFDHGKHVLVEKPLALGVEQCVTLANRAKSSGLTAAVGYHLRNHRFVERAKALIRRGEIGPIRVARSLWSSRLPQGLPAASWRKLEAEGGGSLEDAGVHHIDLLRYLLATEYRNVEAARSDSSAHGSHIQLFASMASGVSAEIAVVQGQFEWQEIEVVGERGRIRMALYDAWGFELLRGDAPAFGIAGRVHRLGAQARELLPGLAAQRNGGDLAQCYVAQWERFVSAVNAEGEPAATFDDGLACARVVAQTQKKTSHEIVLRPSHIADRSSVGDEPSPKTYAPPSLKEMPHLSVVLATPASFLSLRTTLRHLHAQTARNRIEMVLVGPRSLSESLDESYLHPFASFQIVEMEAVRTIAEANAAGARAARGRVIAFAEDHCFPEPQWAEALLAAHQQQHSVVGPVVKNANPGTWISWADFLAGYGPWAFGSTNGDHPGFLPGHNSSYKREILEDLGEDLEPWLEAETVLHQKLAAEGHSLHLESNAVVAHVNFALLDSWADVQFLNGRVFAGMRSRSWGIPRRLLYFVASPLIPFVRTVRSLRPLRYSGISATRRLQTLAGMVFGFCVDGFGQMIGYAAGPGSARHSLARLEFHRSRHIPAQERDELFV